MGWVAGARLVVGHLQRRRPRHPGLGDDDASTSSRPRSPRSRPPPTSRSASTSAPTPADAGDRVDLLIREGVKVASFALAPKPELIARLKEAGVVVIPSVGAAKHAKKVAGWGADAVIVQGGEGGGHTGPVATTLLLPSVLDARRTRIPVIAAGGFFDGRGLAAALSYGAAGVAMGTRFLLTVGLHGARRGQAALPAGGPGRHRRLDPGRRHAAPGAAHRAGREARKRFAGTRFHRRGRATPRSSRRCPG